MTYQNNKLLIALLALEKMETMAVMADGWIMSFNMLNRHQSPLKHNTHMLLQIKAADMLVALVL
jgi:hypothetical protein